MTKRELAMQVSNIVTGTSMRTQKFESYTIRSMIMQTTNFSPSQNI